MIILKQKEIEEELKNLSGWKQEGNKIFKEFEFNNFLEVLDFIKDLSEFFEKNNHHPDIYWSYKRIRFELTSHDVGEKLTDKDFKTVKEIEKRLN